MTLHSPPGFASASPQSPEFHTDVLRIDAPAVAQDLAARLRDVVVRHLKRRGVVVGLSGGIDSSVTAALAVRALGRERVLGLLMPERESAPDTLATSRAVADALGIEAVHEDISVILEAAGAYRRRDDAIRTLAPEYGAGWRSKVVLPSALETDALRVSFLVVRSPAGDERQVRMTADAYLEVVAATNFKQRTRKMLEYFHADARHLCVAGTPNRLEYDQGFFVKGGDGLADVKPIAHLYKQQVYALGHELGVPAAVLERRPTTDTYSLPQGQDEFYFSLPYELMDLVLWARNHDVPVDEVAGELRLSPVQVERVYRDIDQKRRSTRPLHLAPLLLGSMEERSSSLLDGQGGAWA